MSNVKAKNFSFTYPGTDEPTLKDVSFQIESGEILGIIGPMGAGKTTLCVAIAGFAPRILGGETVGNLDVGNGKSSSDDRENEENETVGMVFEDYAAQLIQLKVIDEVVTPLLNRGVPQQEAEKKARELLKKVGLEGEELEKKRIWELSGGQQQRLAIAATLAIEPHILILDNVMDKLDSQGQEQVRCIVAELNGHKTMTIVEQQDTSLLLEKVDRLMVLIDGKAIANGPPHEILRNYELLCQADIEPPVSLQVARALGLSQCPLTLDEFEEAIGSVQKQNEDKSENQPNFGKAVIRLENLTYCYSDGTKALDDVNITIREGEVHAIVGRNGAGKTTTIKHLAGLLQPTKGKVSICDVDAENKSVPDLALMVGTVLQNPDEQISEKTIRDEIAFPLKQRQYERNGWFAKQKNYEDDHIENQIDRACELVGIERNLLDRDPTLLPQGLRKLVTIAAALVVDPKVLILDEPTVGLAATSRRKVTKTIERLRENHKAVLVVSNDVDFVCQIADTVTILERGKIILQGAIREVFAQQNWDRLSQLYIKPPIAAQLGKRIGVTAFTCDELVAKLNRF